MSGHSKWQNIVSPNLTVTMTTDLWSHTHKMYYIYGCKEEWYGKNYQKIIFIIDKVENKV